MNTMAFAMRAAGLGLEVAELEGGKLKVCLV